MLKGFTVIEVALGASEAGPGATQYVYAKRHGQGKNADEKTSRTLFVVNLPPSASFASVKRLFAQLVPGTVISGFVQQRSTEDPIDYSRLTLEMEAQVEAVEHLERGLAGDTVPAIPPNTLLVEFVDKQNLAQFVLKVGDAPRGEWVVETPTGQARYRAANQKRYVEEALGLQQHILEQLTAFQRREAAAMAEVQAAARARPVVDEDGFTLVVLLHRKTKQGILGAVQRAAAQEPAVLAKLKKKERADFYRFQIRERKKQEMQGLLDKYKQDQQRVEAMRQRRRFKPY